MKTEQYIEYNSTLASGETGSLRFRSQEEIDNQKLQNLYDRLSNQGGL